jgi:hypothetical protein
MATEIDGTGEEIRIGESRTIARTTASGSYDGLERLLRQSE